MRDYADVVVKPPFLFVGAILLGCSLELARAFRPGARLGQWARASRRAAPSSLVGLALGLRAVRKSCGAPAPPSMFPASGATNAWSKAGLTASRGTRSISPFVIFYFGLAIMLTSAWMFVLLSRADDLAARRGEREEDYLQAKFGEAYRKYQARVPRWL